jgi:hypothetical protein
VPAPVAHLAAVGISRCRRTLADRHRHHLNRSSVRSVSTPVRSRSGVPIVTIEDWEHHASTKGNWEPHFSAMELARLWLDEAGAGPQAVIDALAPALPDLVLDEGIAEARIAFDAYPGGVRNHDVLAYGHVHAGGVVVGIEGKVNESLDSTIARKYKDAVRPLAPGKSSNLAKRVDALLLAVAGRSLQDDPVLGKLRYQLFSAVAGTLAAAREDTVAAAVVVHLVRTPLANEAKFAAARAAVADFARALNLDADGPVMGPLRLHPEHGATLAVARLVPCWLALVETPALASSA